ncbi:MAG: hypothetical protein PHV30_05260 [Candidatus Margulisbacteria bacterium]|nr:hypothetical protein [Candidatus Margulisiibacteriota bacterium]
MRDKIKKSCLKNKLIALTRVTHYVSVEPIIEKHLHNTRHVLNTLKQYFFDLTGQEQSKIIYESDVIFNLKEYGYWKKLPWSSQRKMSDFRIVFTKIEENMLSLSLKNRHYLYNNLGHLLVNAADSFSRAAFEDKYKEQYPGIKIIVLNNGQLAVLDNGFGRTFEKHYIGHALALPLRRITTIFNRYQPFFFGGVCEGLDITGAKLYTFGSGAVATLGFKNVPADLNPAQISREHIQRTERLIFKLVIATAALSGSCAGLLAYIFG